MNWWARQRIMDVPGRWGSNSNPNATLDDGATGPIQAPSRTGLEQALASVRGSGILPEISPITYNPIAGLGEDYYKGLSDQAAQRLQRQYFSDPNSLLATRSNDLKRRGVYGSGVGESAINSVYSNFGRDMTDIQSQLSSMKAQNDLELGKFNTTNQLNTDYQNRALTMDRSKMALAAAGDEAANATQFDTKMFESAVNQQKGEQDYFAKLLDTLQNSMRNDLTDKTTRQYFENIYGNQIGIPFGYGPDSFSRDQQQTQQNSPPIVRNPSTFGQPSNYFPNQSPFSERQINRMSPMKRGYVF